MKTVKLSWCGWEADGASGYASVARQYRSRISRMDGVEVVGNYSQGWDALIAICTPISWLIGPQRQKRPDLVYHTMFEAEPLPPGWVENMNCAGLIWTPSDYCADLFRRSGVTTPIVKIGYGIDHNSFTYFDRRERKQPFKVLVWGDTLMSRKNVLLSAQAFIKAALPDAELEVKVHSFMGGNFLSQFVDERGDPRSNVSLHHGSWPRDKLLAWLHSGDVGLYLSGGEGLGQMPLEAMATGLTVICAANTGMLEYLTEDNALLVPTAGRVRADSLSLAFDYQATMCQPDVSVAIDHLRWAYTHRQELYDIGDTGYYDSLNWSWDRVCTEARDMLLERYGH